MYHNMASRMRVKKLTHPGLFGCRLGVLTPCCVLQAPYIFQERKQLFCPSFQYSLPITTLRGMYHHCREDIYEVVVESPCRKPELLAMLLTFGGGEGTALVLELKIELGF